MRDWNYIDRVLVTVRRFKPGVRLLVSNQPHPDRFIEAAKVIIDLNLAEIELSNDYQYLIIREPFDYEAFASNAKPRGLAQVQEV